MITAPVSESFSSIRKPSSTRSVPCVIKSSTGFSAGFQNSAIHLWDFYDLSMNIYLKSLDVVRPLILCGFIHGDYLTDRITTLWIHGVWMSIPRGTQFRNLITIKIETLTHWLLLKWPWRPHHLDTWAGQHCWFPAFSVAHLEIFQALQGN